jgi:cholest-4-en-3-one 26-monooxygenase
MTTTTFDHNQQGEVEPGPVHAAFAEMREQCPVVHSPHHGGFHYLTRYDDIRTALTSPEEYSSGDGVFIPPSGLPRIPALEFDEPEHRTWRAVLDGPLTPRAVRAFEPTITEVVDLLVDGFAARGHADLVAELAEPLPAIVIGRMVGMDQEHAIEGREVAGSLFAAIGTADFPERMAGFTAFTEARLAERRAEPREDFLSQIAAGEVAGVPIDAEGAAGLMVAYMLGGHHSTASGVAGLLHHVLGSPELRADLAEDPTLLPRVVEESLRLTTPLQLFARTTRCPVTAGDVDLPESSRVMLNLASANRDPREFPDPDAFDARRPRNRHVTFGAGAHVCQGQHLARAELRIALTRVLERLPDVRIDGEVVERSLIGGKLSAVRVLPVRFTPEHG